MTGMKRCRNIVTVYVAILLLSLIFTPEFASAQGEEVASPLRRYKEYEVSTGYYEEYEVLPRR